MEVFFAGFGLGVLTSVTAFAIWLGTLNWMEAKRWASLAIHPTTRNIYIIDDPTNIDPLIGRKNNQIFDQEKEFN